MNTMLFFIVNTMNLTNRRFYIFIFLSMLFVSTKLACNPLFSRQMDLHLSLPLIRLDYTFKVTCSALIYPLIYILSDLIVLVTNKKTAIIVTLFGIFIDGLSSALFTYIAHKPLPMNMSETERVTSQSFNAISIHMWQLFNSGLIANIVVAIVEIIMFAFFLRKINNFFISVMVSIIVTLAIHYPLTDYRVLSHEPDALHILLHNFATNVAIMSIYAIFVTFGIYVINVIKYKVYKRKINS